MIGLTSSKAKPTSVPADVITLRREVIDGSFHPHKMNDGAWQQLKDYLLHKALPALSREDRIVLTERLLEGEKTRVCNKI